MAKKYRMLRRLMSELDVDQAWLAAKLKRSRSYIADRLTDGRWELGEVYTIGNLLRIPKDKLLVYFPESGNDGLPSLRDEHDPLVQIYRVV